MNFVWICAIPGGAYLLVKGERLLHAAQGVVCTRQERKRLSLQLQARRMLVHYLGRLQRLQRGGRSQERS